MKSLEICKSNLYKTKGLNNILLLDSPLGLDIIADSGLMNKSNVALLRQAGYKYILGVRIRSERVPIKQGIFSLERKDKSCCEYKDTLPIQILTLNVLSLNITDYGRNVLSEFQKGHWKCTPCFTLQKEGLRHMYAPASSSAKYTRNWRDLLALTRLR